VSAYGAFHVGLARALGCPLVTGDLRLARAPGLGVPVVAV
jgi:predicted nucleic acid-binding protein